MKIPSIVFITADPESEFSQQMISALRTLEIPTKIFRPEDIKRMNGNADITLFAPDFQLTEYEVKKVFFAESIPVAPEETALCANYHPNTEEGNAFLYRGSSIWTVFASLIRAIETFQFPYDWRHIVRNGVETLRNLQKSSAKAQEREPAYSNPSPLELS